MTPAARIQAAIELLEQIEAADRPADAVVAAYLRARRYIGAKDRRALLATVYGILRRRARLDWHLRRAGLEPTARRWAMAERALDGEAPAALFDGSRHGPAPPTAAEARAMTGMAAAALDDPAMPAWVRGEYPAWLEPALCESLGDGLGAEMAAMAAEAPLDLRANLLKADRETARAALAAEGVRAEPTPLSPWGLRIERRINLAALAAFRDGLVEVQDEGSQMVALLADVRPGQAVLDYCAGAGGKTLALAAGMANRGRLVAVDTAAGRLRRAGARLRRAGVHNARLMPLDVEGRRYLKRHAGGFDRVLVDAPCSGTGTWRRNPDAKWRLRPDDLESLRRTQQAVLDEAAALVRPGGRLVYATCSLLAAENEAQVGEMLARRPDFVVLPARAAWAGAPATDDMLRLTPARHGTDGFFVAVLERVGN